MLKSLLMASALTLAFSGAAMASDAPQPVSAGCTSCALPTSNLAAPVKLAQLGPIRGNSVQMSDAIPVPRGDSNVISVCCPPIAKQSFAPYFRVHQLAGKNITQTYGLDFLPTAALDAQMKAFAPFAALFSPYASPNSVLLDAEMRELNVPTTWNATSAAVTESAFNSSTTPVYRHALRGWWTNPGSGIWNGPHADFGNHPWEQTFQDGKHVTPGSFMQPNKWYVIKLTLQLASKNRPDDNTWFVNPIDCMKKFVAIRVQSAGFKGVAGGGTAASAAQIIDLN
jgi:hypothetical protein